MYISTEIIFGQCIIFFVFFFYTIQQFSLVGYNNVPCTNDVNCRVSITVPLPDTVRLNMDYIQDIHANHNNSRRDKIKLGMIDLPLLDNDRGKKYIYNILLVVDRRYN